MKIYSTSLTQPKHPSKNQAIILPTFADTRAEDYFIPLGELIESKDILYYSKLSNNRLCIYLASEFIVDTYLKHGNGTITVNNERIQARRYVTPSERNSIECMSYHSQQHLDERTSENKISITFLNDPTENKYIFTPIKSYLKLP
ncbi:hypothetical protein HHI36_002034 [Cryptolaemus montrouzieri]|uniref:Uncharacterized protein n=1 Tax=Cryptolaemus montrouzieri TaxID=559131 RepID=A0ABD2P9Z4_9CUCU